MPLAIAGPTDRRVLAHRPDHLVYERDTLVPSVPGTRLDVDPQELVGYRPSHCCLAWYQGRLGFHVRSDLLGDDRPEAVARQYEAEAAWLAEAG